MVNENPKLKYLPTECPASRPLFTEEELKKEMKDFPQECNVLCGIRKEFLWGAHDGRSDSSFVREYNSQMSKCNDYKNQKCFKGYLERQAIREKERHF